MHTSHWVYTCVQIVVHFSHVGIGRADIYSDDGLRFKCPLDPLTDRYPDPTDPTCVNYFLCHLGHAFPRKCTVRTAFHPELKECYPRYQVPETLCSLPIDCDYNGYIPDPEDCTKYYICFFRQAIHYSCLTNHYFDSKKHLCVKDKKKANACSLPRPEIGPSPKKHVFQRTRYARPAPAAAAGAKLEEPEYVPNNNDPQSPPEPASEYLDVTGSGSIEPSVTNVDLAQQGDNIDVEDGRTEQFPKMKRNTEGPAIEPVQNTTVN